MYTTIFSVLLFTFSSALANDASIGAADELKLLPGSNAVIEARTPTRVSCNADARTFCRVEYTSGWYFVMIGDKQASAGLLLDDAIKIVKNLREGGLCN